MSVAVFLLLSLLPLALAGVAQLQGVEVNLATLQGSRSTMYTLNDTRTSPCLFSLSVC